MQKLNQFTIVGISVKTTNENNQAQIDIPKLWELFFKENIFSKITNKINNKVYAVYTDYEGDYMKPYRLIIGCAVSNDDQKLKDLSVKVIPHLNYEVFNVSGKYPECLVKTWQNIWQSDLNRAYIVDLEVYPKDFDPNNARLDIYISVK